MADIGIRVQLCGRLVVNLYGRRVESGLPGRKGRMLFGYLAVNRDRSIPREELLDALWGAGAPKAAETDLSAMLSRIRRAIGADYIEGRSEVRLNIPPDALVDVEVALDAAHRAEAHLAHREWAKAFTPSATAIYIPARVFLRGLEGEWIDAWRRRLEQVMIRGLECHAASNLGLGGPALPVAERTAASLVERAPFRETGYRIWMEALAAQGNVAEALHLYERLRRLLREELGVAPSPEVQGVHLRLLELTAND